MAKFNGYRNWAQWNVSLWLNNDEYLYSIMLNMTRRYKFAGRKVQAERTLERLHDEGIVKTPDGAIYSVTSIRAAMVGI